MVVLFVDLKAAFDSVDREVLVRAMRGKGVREELVVRCEEILRETTCRVRVGDEERERFWTARGVKQGCSLSPSLFTLLIADMEEELKKGGWGKFTRWRMPTTHSGVFDHKSCPKVDFKNFA